MSVDTLPSGHVIAFYPTAFKGCVGFSPSVWKGSQAFRQPEGRLSRLYLLKCELQDVDTWKGH